MQILTAATTDTNSTPFRVSQNNQNVDPRNRPVLLIYGTLGTATLALKYKAPDGNYYATGDRITGLCAFPIGHYEGLVLRLDTVSGGGSSLNAAVLNGTAE